jgi:hypothetical protein
MSSTKQGDGTAPNSSVSGAKAALVAPPVMSPRLLKRLGEAAMGTGRKYGEQYWICRYVPDVETKKYGIDGPFHTWDEAQDAIGDRLGFGVFGPYEPGEYEGLISMVHPSAEVVAVLVYLEGVVEPIEIDASTFDALFWSPAAIEKFVFPYYCGAEGLDYTIQVRDDYVALNAYLMAHSDDTEYSLWGGSRGEGFVPTLEPLTSSR